MTRQNGCRKGQISTELLFITALGLVFVGGMFFLSIMMSTDTIRQIQAKDTVERISKSADLVYAMGPGAKTSIEVIMPDNIRFINISGSRVLIRVGMTGGDTDIFAHSDGTLVGNLTRQAGRQTVTLSVDNSSIVRISSTG